MLVEPTPEVMMSHALAAKLFDREEGEYMPHLSLVYGFYPETLKREIINRLPSDVRASFIVRSLCLLEARSTDPCDWREVAEFPLAVSTRDQRPPDR
jgi:hypothetical protein